MLLVWGRPNLLLAFTYIRIIFGVVQMLMQKIIHALYLVLRMHIMFVFLAYPFLSIFRVDWNDQELCFFLFKILLEPIKIRLEVDQNVESDSENRKWILSWIHSIKARGLLSFGIGFDVDCISSHVGSWSSGRSRVIKLWQLIKHLTSKLDQKAANEWQ